MRSLYGVIAIAACCTAPAFAQIPMEQGNWHIRITSTANGKAEPVQEQDECMKEEVNDLQKYFSPRLDADVQAKCTKATQQQTRDKSIAYKMKCTGDGFTIEMESSFRVENPKHFIATLKMDSKWQNRHLVVVHTIDGRHAGPCTAFQESVR
jgi:hypothetical protein